MCLQFGLLMSEAVLVFSRHSSLFSPPKYAYGQRVNLHGYLMGGALCCVLAGLAIIYSIKNAGGKSHWTTWHGGLGKNTVIYACAQLGAGVFLKYAPSLKVPKLSLIKLGHAASGTVLFTLATVTLVLGLRSTWYQSHAPFPLSVFAHLAIALLCAAVIGQLGYRLQALKPKANKAKSPGTK